MEGIELLEYHGIKLKKGNSVICCECNEETNAEEWREGNVSCELCGEHGAIICPDCGEFIDMIYKDEDMMELNNYRL